MKIWHLTLFVIGYSFQKILFNLGTYYKPIPKYEKYKSIIIDSPTFFGNSGGPVFEFIDQGLNKIPLLIGIVTEYIPYIEKWENKNNGAINVQTMNSGYSIVTSIDFAIDLMKIFEVTKYRLTSTTGIYKINHSNGKPWTEIVFKAGLTWNILYNYDRNGKNQEKGSLKDGNGTIYSYDESGKLLTIETIKDGYSVKIENINIIHK